MSSDITEMYPKLQDLVNNMFETMHKGHGIGLSAIQIGIPIRLFVIEAHQKPLIDMKQVFINPRIIERSEEEDSNMEGCLSIPGITTYVKRKKDIVVEYYDENWVKKEERFSDMPARVIQHEMDHLTGTLFIDDIGPIWEKTIGPILALIKDRDEDFLSNVNYLCKK